MTSGPTQKVVPELACHDFTLSLRFYTQVLGFSVLYDRPEEGFAFLEREGAQLMIDALNVGRSWLKAAAEYPLGRGLNLQIEVADVTALYEAVCAAKAEVFLKLEEKWYRKNDLQVGNKQFIVSDPDGYLLRFWQNLGVRPL